MRILSVLERKFSFEQRTEKRISSKTRPTASFGEAAALLLREVRVAVQNFVPVVVDRCGSFLETNHFAPQQHQDLQFIGKLRDV